MPSTPSNQYCWSTSFDKSLATYPKQKCHCMSSTHSLLRAKTLERLQLFSLAEIAFQFFLGVAEISLIKLPD